MIDLYTWNTPNGYKVPILLAELAEPYTLHLVDIHADEQHTTSFDTLNPNHKIPVCVDSEHGITLSESGAILIYLAERSGQFLPSEPKARARALQWLMFQMSAVGPLFGQANHFLHYAPEKVAYGIERYTTEATRIMGVLEKHLTENDYLAGTEYSIADIATWPWIKKGIAADFVSIEAYPHVQRWYERVGERPAVQAAIAYIDSEVAVREHSSH